MKNLGNLPDGFSFPSVALSNAMNTQLDVALFLWNQDIIQMMSWLLLDRNVESDGVEPAEGEDAIENLIACWSPKIVVFDMIPPYQSSAAVLARLLNRFPELSFIVTCADSTLALRKAPWLSRLRLFQKPYDPYAVVDLIQTKVASYKIVNAVSVGA
jgi:hypothetical protein